MLNHMLGLWLEGGRSDFLLRRRRRRVRVLGLELDDVSGVMRRSDSVHVNGFDSGEPRRAQMKR